MERHCEEELGNLMDTLIRVGGLVDAQRGATSRALFEGDREVHPYDPLNDRQSQEIFALTQPVAIDLRLLIGGISVNSAGRTEPLSPARKGSFEGCGAVAGPAPNAYVERH